MRIYKNPHRDADNKGSTSIGETSQERIRMHTLVREMILARISSFEQRIEAFDLVRKALVIDVARQTIGSQLPGAVFLVRNPPESPDILGWIGISMESGVSESEDEQAEYDRFSAPDDFVEVGGRDTYQFALFDNGMLRPLEHFIEESVEKATGFSFNSLIMLAHDNDFGAGLSALGVSTERALRMVGWDSLVRTHTGVEVDADSGAENDVHTSLYWVRVLLDDRGPALLDLAHQLLDTDVRVKKAYELVGEGRPWSAESLPEFKALSQQARIELRSAKIDLIEIDVRTILDLSGTVGEPTGLIATVIPITDWEPQRFTEIDELKLERCLVPIRVVCGTLPIFDFINFDQDSPTLIDGMEWDRHDNSLNEDLQEIDESDIPRLDGIELEGFRHSVVVDGTLFDDFFLIRFGA